MNSQLKETNSEQKAAGEIPLGTQVRQTEAKLREVWRETKREKGERGETLWRKEQKKKREREKEREKEREYKQGNDGGR